MYNCTLAILESGELFWLAKQLLAGEWSQEIGLKPLYALAGHSSIQTKVTQLVSEAFRIQHVNEFNEK